jgi:DHA1 family multidrug resistance protein-like MFS transporter
VPYSRERFDVEQVLSVQKTKSVVLAPRKTADGTILVDWYSTDDPANPQNWPSSKKAGVLLQLCLYSLAVYGASSMYVPGEQGVMDQFGVGAAPAAVGLAIYVVGYGVGPLVFAPLSEIAAIGRNWVYIPTFALFVILSIPTALVDNYAGLLVLRFLTGFFGSPCLANGGASVGDMVNNTLVLTRFSCTLTGHSILSLNSLFIYQRGRQLAFGAQPLVRSLQLLLCKLRAGAGDFGKLCG